MRHPCRWICTLGLGILAIPATGLAREHDELKLWPNGLPAGARPLAPERVEKLKGQNTLERIAYVEEPTLTLYAPAQEKANGCAVVVCPGGGYNILAWNKEGIEIAEWFNSFGVFAAVLKYRVPRRDPDHPHREPLQDAQRAIRMVRQNADAWGVDPNRIGMVGFSAGGHLTVMAGTHWDAPTYPKVDAADDLSCRPDFMIPVYAAYLGDNYDDSQPALGPLVRTTPRTPPTFMAVALDDRARGAQAALLLVELKKAGVPAELHVFSQGGHGYGLRPSPHPVAAVWPRLCGLWMREMGLLHSPTTSRPARKEP